jgi:hypothetical protein
LTSHADVYRYIAIVMWTEDAEGGMERTATAQRKLGAKPTRLPAAVDLSRLEVEGAVRALRVLMAAVELMVARTELAERVRLEEAVDRRCPQLREEQTAYPP